MAEALPVPIGDPSIVLTAIAKAAAEIAAQEAGRRQGGTLDREAVEEIVDEAIREAFGRIGVDLGDLKSIAAFNATITHAERSRGLWSKAGLTAFGVLIASLASAVITAVVKFILTGGGK